MIPFLKAVRKRENTFPVSKQVLFTILIFISGLFFGFLAKYLDLHTQHLGNVFSQMSIWILFGTILSVKSRSPARASINVFSFCIGMLITYYITTELAKGVYSMTFVYGWAAFSLLSPIFAYLAWFSRGRGWIAKGISCGILLCMLLCAVLLFDKIRLSDLILLFLTALFLFVPPNGKAPQ